MKTADDIAREFLGVKEIGSNQGFTSKILTRLMDVVNYQLGHAWCAYFTRIISEKYFAQYSGHAIKLSRKKGLLTPSVMKTYRKIQAYCPESISRTPQSKNSLVVWQHFTNNIADGRGHIAVLEYLNQGVQVATIDGNTNKKGSREGDGVYQKLRMINKTVETGLNFLGFICLDTLLKKLENEIEV